MTAIFFSRRGLLSVLAGLLSAAFPVCAQESSDPANETVPVPEAPFVEAIDPEVSFEDFLSRREFQERTSNLSWKKGDLTITPYGFIWVNAALNSGACVSDAFCLYNYSAEMNDSASSAVDARTSRLGVKVDGPAVAGSCYKMRGVVEIDFQGAANMTRNKGQVQFRKGFVELVNEANQTKFQFGQDWDTISPLAPMMLNYLPAGYAGNIGYRRAQMRFEKGRTWSPDLHTVTTIGIADPFPGDFFSTSCVSANSGSWPIIEGRFGASFGKRSRCAGPITFGVSGHIGENTYIFSPVAGSYQQTWPRETSHLKTWSVNVDADVPLSKRFRLQGEYFLGENLSGFCGGINQGVDLYTRSGVRAQGGWLSLHTQLTEKLINNTGYAIDKPFDEDLIGNCVPDAAGFTNARTKNSLIFTNFLYQWNKAFMTGIEFGYWKTDYRKADVTSAVTPFSAMKPGENFRVDFATQYLF